MTTDNWITISSAVLAGGLVALGWFATGYQNRLKDIAQRRLDYRLKALETFLPVWFAIQKSGAPFAQPGFLELLEDSRSKFQLYGRDDEIRVFERFISGIENRDLQDSNAALKELLSLVRRRIRGVENRCLTPPIERTDTAIARSCHSSDIALGGRVNNGCY